MATQSILSALSLFLLLIPSLVATATSHLTPEITPQNVPSTKSSFSPWLEEVMGGHHHHHHHHHHKPRQPGCRWRPWICRQGEHPLGARMRCCGNQCVDVLSDVNHCRLCIIRCPFGWQCCRGFCINVMVSRFNCGRCGHRCPRRSRCIYGLCSYA